MLTCLVLCLTMTVIVSQSIIREVYEINLKNALLQSQKTEAQLIALWGQINPHYLYNTLETIRMNLVVKGDRLTANIISLFADSFRTCVEDTDENEYDLRFEIEFLKKYFAIQDYRMRGRVTMEIYIPDYLYDCLIPKLILQPLLENAVYHGVEMKEGNGVIQISGWEQDGDLHITISDDGIGIEENTMNRIIQQLNSSEVFTTSKNERLALKNVNSRLKLIYSDRYALQICSKPGEGTAVKISLPIVHKKVAGDKEKGDNDGTV